jgi:hypothetical protein
MTARAWPISHVRSLRLFGAMVLIFAALLFSSQLALAQFTQQGPKLVGTGAVRSAVQGTSVALSADGNTAIVGGPGDNSGFESLFNMDIPGIGAVWIYTRRNGVWTQQGSKLVGTGAVGSATQGQSVALSADGDTALVGGPYDNPGYTFGFNARGPGAGAVWFFTRSGGAWSQQGSKVVGTGAVGDFVYQGESVALSADGNTALVGGPGDGSGAAWVFTRSSGNVWSQQGSKLIATGAVRGEFGRLEHGTSAALSADGDTAIVGGPGDNTLTGAAWIYTRSGNVWSQQGNKLVATGEAVAPFSFQGRSVALSADGNTAIVGGRNAAAWVYTRSGNVWNQQGSKLRGTGVVGQETSVALSADGNTALVGVPGDNSDTGAAWVYIRTGNVWSQHGGKLVGTGAVGNARQGWSVALSADGNTAIMGGDGDNSNVGAAWIFVQPTKDAKRRND